LSLLVRKIKPAAAVGAKALGIPAASVHYDPELEKQRLAFEMQKYEEEKAARFQQIADDKAERLRLETVRLQQIEDDKAERLCLEARADAERLRQEEKAEAERIRLAEERHLQQMQFEWHRN